jgi:hypothetical protein
MDLSEEYIWMCIMAKEVQELWKPKVGDHAKHGNHVVGTYVMQYADWKEGKADIEGLMWLPRQDQLQEMVRREHEYRNGKSWQVNYILLFSDWIRKTIDPLSHTDISAEILSLMYVMALKFNKQWNGQDWEEMK